MNLYKPRQPLNPLNMPIYRPTPMLPQSNARSKIGFIKTLEGIKEVELFYIKYCPSLNIGSNSMNNHIKDAVFTDDPSTQYLKLLYRRQLSEQSKYIGKDFDDFELTPDIKSLQRVVKYYSYVRILEDDQNPQLVDQVKLFAFGRVIFTKMKDLIGATAGDKNVIFNKEFLIEIALRHGFPDYKESRFLNEDFYEEDHSLLISDFVNHKRFTNSEIVKATRKNKLNKIFGTPLPAAKDDDFLFGS